MTKILTDASTTAIDMIRLPIMITPTPVHAAIVLPWLECASPAMGAPSGGVGRGPILPGVSRTARAPGSQHANARSDAPCRDPPDRGKKHCQSEGRCHDDADRGGSARST